MGEQLDRQVCVVGPRRLQNELMASFVTERTGIATVAVPSLEQVPANGSRSTLVLKDCPPGERTHLLDRLSGTASLRGDGHLLALFNVHPEHAIEQEVFPHGVKGFFYKHDGPDSLLRGIEAMFEGELWMSRRAMSECLLSGATVLPPSNGGESVLTQREGEILGLLAVGAANDEISDKLCISVNTVKTHVYRIFRKIEVDNRLQAALWAAKNL